MIISLISSYAYIGLATFRFNRIMTAKEYFIMQSFEVSFAVNLCVQFITDYQIDGDKKPITDFKKIAMNYIDGDFWLDFLPLIPF